MGSVGRFIDIRAFSVHTGAHTHTYFICAFEADALCEHIWCEADLEGVLLLCPREQMSLALTQYFLLFPLFAPSLSPSSSLIFLLSPPFFFCFDQMERCSTLNLSHSGSQCSESCDPACYLLLLSVCFSLSLSIHKHSLSLFLSVLYPLTKADKGLSFLLGCLCSLCLYCTKLGSLSHCIPSFSLQRRCLGAPGPPF